MTWLQTTNVDLRTLPPSEPSMVACCYCNLVVDQKPGGEDRCACPPERGVAYEGKRFVYGIRSYFVRVELALAASLLLTLGGCAASGDSWIWFAVLLLGGVGWAMNSAVEQSTLLSLHRLSWGDEKARKRRAKRGIAINAVLSIVALLLAACSH